MDQIKTGKYIITLIKALFDKTKPEEKPDDITFYDIYRMGKKHHILNMCFYAIDQLETKPIDSLYREWSDQTRVSSAQSLVQLQERDSVLRTIQNAEIDCLPLKGCYLKEMYPCSDYREMADLDILIHKEDQTKVRTIMESAGYHTEDYDTDISVHDIYSKPPFMEVEIHRALFNSKITEKYHLDKGSLPIVTDPWSRARQTDNPHVYEFSPEDTYLFLILHLAKHFYGAGIGIRQFTDIWVYTQKCKLDKEYIYKALENTELLQFCKDTENLVNAWFGNGEMNEELVEMERYILYSGVYGQLTNTVRRRLEETADGNKFVYVVTRAFPSLDFMRHWYPALKKYPILLPYTWVHRWLVKMFKKGSPAMKEIKAFIRISRTDKEKSNH